MIARLARVFAVVAAVVCVPVQAGAQEPTVLVAKLEGAVTPVIANHLVDAVELAEERGAAALLVEIDTPGGLDSSMREIVRSFLGSRVPVIAYVAPAGARAASAGAIVALASHVAAMAPGTNIGAATPVSLTGEVPEEVGRKVVNDAAAYVEAIAELRGRDDGFYVDAVRDGRSASASEALEVEAIDLVADTRDELLREVDGMEVSVGGGRQVTISTAGVAVEPLELDWSGRIRQRLADPNLAFLFMSIGTLAVVYEFANPGAGLGGIIGGILIVLALFSLSVLPVNVVGLLLLLLALVLFGVEVFVPGIGVFAAGGAVALALSGLFLFRGSVSVSLMYVLPLAVVAGVGALFAGRLAQRTRGAPSETGAGQLVGRVAVLRDAADHRGRVSVDGAWWNVRSTSGALETGQEVRIVDMEGLELVVEPVTQEED